MTPIWDAFIICLRNVAEIEINFNDQTQGIIVYGLLRWDEKNNLPSINGLGVYVPEMFRITDKPEKITPEPQKPVVEEPKSEEASKFSSDF